MSRARYAAVAAGPARDCAPCGMCLQALAESGYPQVVARTGGEVRTVHLHDLPATAYAAGGARHGGPAGTGEGGR